MKNLKIRVNSADESKEAQELLFELGAKKVLPDIVCFSKNVRAVCCICNSVLVNTISFESCSSELKEITLPELRAMVRISDLRTQLAKHDTLDLEPADIPHGTIILER